MSEKVFETLKNLDIDAYLMYDFRGSNFIARRVLNFKTYTTRRWVAIFSKDQRVKFIIPKLEESHFSDLEGEKLVYKTYQEFYKLLKESVSEYSTIAIDYSENNDIPVLDILPAGFVELLRKSNPETSFVSSANLSQYLASTWGAEGYSLHKKASEHLKEILFLTIEYIKNNLGSITDYDARMFIINEYKKRNLYVDEDICIVSTNERTGDPHYWPQENLNHVIEKNSVLLIDIWAKLNEENSVYSDSTFMAWIGPDPIPAKVQEIWDIVKTARDIGIKTVEKNINNDLMGFEVDREVRNYIESKGYGDYFVHRTGHSIDSSDHGNGANIDDFETHDTRLILPDTGFSIEPGIYLPEFGFRSEIDIYVHMDKTVEVSTYRQDGLIVV